MITKIIISWTVLTLLATACAPQSISVSPTEVTPESVTPTQEVQSQSSSPEPIIPTKTERISPTHTPTPVMITPTYITPTISITVTPASAAINKNQSDAIIIDHTSVDLFDQIPEQYLAAARDLRMMYSDRSVGQNINEALDCLTATNWQNSPPYCRVDYYSTEGSNWKFKTYTIRDYQSNNVPPRILFTPDPIKYNRSNWEFVVNTGEWEELIKNFVADLVPSYVDSKDVLSYQVTYLNVEEGSTIDDPDIGFFSDQPHEGFYVNRERWDISDLEEMESQYPDKTFFYWTTSLARSIGSPDAAMFNDQMREYAITNSKILFDVADIESHDDKGNPCYDNRDGIEYCGTQGCENLPDDQKNIPAICQDYTTEIEGGHLGSVSAGHLRIAKAFWVLMARVAGWDGK